MQLRASAATLAGSPWTRGSRQPLPLPARSQMPQAARPAGSRRRHGRHPAMNRCAKTRRLRQHEASLGVSGWRRAARTRVNIRNIMDRRLYLHAPAPAPSAPVQGGCSNPPAPASSPAQRTLLRAAQPARGAAWVGAPAGRCVRMQTCSCLCQDAATNLPRLLPQPFL